MYKLTQNRLAQAKPILDDFKNELAQKRVFNTHAFERELRDCWNVGYQSLKGIMRDLLYNEEYKFIAAYYMEHSNSTGVVSEFQKPLADLYGIERFVNRIERQQAVEAFWSNAFTKMTLSASK